MITATQTRPDAIDANLAAFRAGLPGIYEGILAAEYHALDAVSSSFLKRAHTHSLKHARAMKLEGKPPTDEMDIGQGGHCRLFTPSEFENEFTLAGKCCRKTKLGKHCRNNGRYCVGGEWLCGTHVKDDRHDAVYAAIHERLTGEGFALTHTSEAESRYYSHEDGRKYRVADHAPTPFCETRLVADGRQQIRVDLPPYGDDDARTILDPEDMARVTGICDAVRADPLANSILAAATDLELSVVWKDKPTGLLCKARLDVLCRAQGIMPDLKTCRSLKSFNDDAYRLAYQIQMAHYQNGALAHDLPAESIAVIAAENTKPHDVAVPELDRDLLVRGHEQWTAVMEKLYVAVTTDIWPGIGQEIQSLTIPRWDRKREFQPA